MPTSDVQIFIPHVFMAYRRPNLVQISLTNNSKQPEFNQRVEGVNVLYPRSYFPSFILSLSFTFLMIRSFFYSILFFLIFLLLFYTFFFIQILHPHYLHLHFFSSRSSFLLFHSVSFPLFSPDLPFEQLSISLRETIYSVTLSLLLHLILSSLFSVLALSSLSLCSLYFFFKNYSPDLAFDWTIIATKLLCPIPEDPSPQAIFFPRGQGKTTG